MPKAPIASCMMVAPVCMCMCVCVCARLRAREQALVRASACEFKQTHTSWGNAVFAGAMQVDAHTEAKACDHKALKHRSGTHTHSTHSTHTYGAIRRCTRCLGKTPAHGTQHTAHPHTFTRTLNRSKTEAHVAQEG